MTYADTERVEETELSPKSDMKCRENMLQWKTWKVQSV